MTIQKSSLVIQVIDGNEKYVGSVNGWVPVRSDAIEHQSDKGKVEDLKFFHMIRQKPPVKRSATSKVS